ncbi:uncharacterized protein N7469_002209 [Penicillium citrinum]|uniref:Uncharacterized protein n=1 Tax=Penicillium citrinum TaxID=5077 RepID=A0A9W9PA00_PENCI|nr:uncharacterized protein N7469_002209 [Penicillium citrinum]KAJ5240618.1 hypothetical protein N7469_002209 [Penicillium citrinum]
MPWFWKNNHRSNKARQDRNGLYQKESWHTYDAIGDAAIEAVEAAYWCCEELRELAGGFLRKEIDRPDAVARLARLKLKSSQRKARGSICLGGVE